MTIAREEFDALPAQLPLPGAGLTAERFRALWQIASSSPPLGRLAEAHYDGQAILAEAGRAAAAGAVYAVWAAGGPDPATLHGSRLTGTKHWCSGATIATHALVTARHQGTNALVLVDLSRDGVVFEAPTWRSPAFDATDTRAVRFDLEIDLQDVIAVDDWYLTRPGFWHGAIGVAACWAGCAGGLVGRVLGRWPTDAHAFAHLGAIDATVSAMRAILDQAAREIDDSRTADDRATSRQIRALRVRHLVDVSVADITTRLGRAIGPGPLAHVPDLHLALAETDLYRRQCHAERDLEVLGRLALDPSSPA